MNREDFPMLKQDYIYFNSAATTYKPNLVIDAIVDYYQNYSFNTNRGVDSASYMVTEKYEQTRNKVAEFISASASQIVFTRGTTEAINLASSFFKENLKAGDQVLVSNEEHHAVFVTMQQLCFEKNLDFKVVDFENIVDSINSKTKLVAISHITNVLGKRSDLEKIAALKNKYNFYFLVDGAQGIVHEKTDVKKLKIDFYAFSGHKIYGPFGVGVLYSNQFNNMKPIVFGGEMVDQVNKNTTSFKKAPYKFEAGTMMIPEVIALKNAIEYIEKLSYEKINNHVLKLRNYLIAEMKKDSDIIIYNEKSNSNMITFNIKNYHAHDIATFLDKNKIIVRAGHHCAAPLMDKLNVNATIRLSLGLYNNMEECKTFIDVLKKKEDFFDVLF